MYGFASVPYPFSLIFAFKCDNSIYYIDYEKYRFKKYKTPNKFIVLYKKGGKVRAKLMNTYHDYGINM